MSTFYSFVIPTYNRAHCIINTLRSILNQSYSYFEIIIVDDGSTDNTQVLINNEIKSYKIKYFRYEINRGTNYAKNFGAEKSNGEYLIFLDSDDILAANTSLGDIEHEMFSNHYPSLSMFACKDLSQRVTVVNKKFRGIVSFKEYFLGKYKGEYLPVVKKNNFLQRKFYTEIHGGEGITWVLLTKDIGCLYITNTIVRIYDNTGTDRLSFLNKKNILRIRNVFIKDLKVNYKDYLRIYKVGLLLVLVKILYYHIRVTFSK